MSFACINGRTECSGCMDCDSSEDSTYKAWYCSECLMHWNNREADHKPPDAENCPFCGCTDVVELEPDDPKECLT